MSCWTFSVYYIRKLDQSENHTVSNVNDSEKVSVAAQLGHMEVEWISFFT